MNIKLLVPAAIMLMTAFGASKAQADLLDDIRKAGVLKVATSLGVEPFTFVDAQMQPIGSDVETAKLLADDLGVKLEIVSTTVTSRIPTLMSGKADVVISVLAITPERKEIIDFSPPYSVDNSVVMGPKSKQIKSFADLAGETVGVTRGTIEDKAITENATGAEIRRYEDVPTTITAVISGQVTIGTGSLSTLKWINASAKEQYEPKITIRNSQLGIGYRKDNPEFGKWVSDWVAENLKNGKLSAIYKKYNGVDLPMDALSATE